jgi:uncharacterized membrane protein YccC
MTIQLIYSRLKLLVQGEYAQEALRALAITLIPGILLGYWTKVPYGIALSLGALTASLVDLPTQWMTKWRTAIWSIPLYFLVSYIIGTSVSFPIALVISLVFCAFVCTMLGAFGMRMGLLGTTAMLLAAFTIGFRVMDPLLFALWIAAGAALYHSISLLMAYVQPHRALTHALQEGIRSTAQLLRAKAYCYRYGYPLETAFESIAALHIKVSDQQEQIRERLISRKAKTEELTLKERKWWARAYALMDLYEQITAVDKDYETIRQQLHPAQALEPIEKLILHLADEVEALAQFRQDKEREQIYLQNRVVIGDLIRDIRRIRDHQDAETAQILTDTLRNVQDMFACFYRIRSAKEDAHMERILSNPAQRQSFLTYPAQGWKALKGHLHLQSPVFIFALRLAALMFLGASLGLVLPDNQYMYWILLTIIIVARPIYAITQKRNTERMLGTMGGACVGVTVLWAIPSIEVQWVLAIMFLYGFLVYNRPVYLWSVWCITPAVMIGLQWYEGDFLQILGSRLAYTLAGCGLALLGWYLIPFRTSKHLPQHARKVKHALTQFVLQIQKNLQGEDTSFETRIARKEAHVAMAALSDALLHLRKEPGKNPQEWHNWQNFQKQAYSINGRITSLHLALMTNTYQEEAMLESKVEQITQQIQSL